MESEYAKNLRKYVYGVAVSDAALLAAADALDKLEADKAELVAALDGLAKAYAALPGAVTIAGSRHSHAVYALAKHGGPR